jgi:hypothetical protein
MNCKECKYWMPLGETISSFKELNILTEEEIGSCFNSFAIDSIIKTDSEDAFTVTVIMGATTGLITKQDFACKYHELKK